MWQLSYSRCQKHARRIPRPVRPNPRVDGRPTATAHQFTPASTPSFHVNTLRSIYTTRVPLDRRRRYFHIATKNLRQTSYSSHQYESEKSPVNPEFRQMILKQKDYRGALKFLEDLKASGQATQQQLTAHYNYLYLRVGKYAKMLYFEQNRL